MGSDSESASAGERALLLQAVRNTLDDVAQRVEVLEQIPGFVGAQINEVHRVLAELTRRIAVLEQRLR
jgi:hypothetical protein